MPDANARQLVEILGPVRSGRQPERSSGETGPKRRVDLGAAIAASGLRSGGVVSFHHHYRNGDHLLNAALEVMANRGLRDLTLAASSIFPVHEPLVGHLKSGVVRQVITFTSKGRLQISSPAGR